MADIVVMGWNRFERFDDDFEQMQDRLDYIPIDKLDDIMNISFGASGTIISSMEAWLQNERRFEIAKGTKTGINKVRKYINPSIDKLGKVSKKIGIIGAGYSVVSYSGKVLEGKPVTIADTFDTALTVGLSIVAISNPVA